MDTTRNAISAFIEKYYLHFNAAALVDAAKGYEQHLSEGGKMMITLAGAMSTAEMGKILAELIRQDKVHIISFTGANLAEQITNLEANKRNTRAPLSRAINPPATDTLPKNR